MAFDPTKTLDLVKGGLLEPRETWTKYLDGNPSWQDTATQLTGPLLVANVLLTLVFSRLIGGYVYFGYGQSFIGALVSGLVAAALGVAVAAGIICFLAGVFKGTADFSRAFAAVSLAAIPAWVAGVAGAVIPWIGWLIALAGGILSLVYLYRILPVALSIPEDKRALHFSASIICILVINMIVGAVLGAGGASRGVDSRDFSKNEDGRVFSSGILGEMERQGRLMEAAQSDLYEPPENGKLTRSQVEDFIGVIRKKQALEEKYAAEMQKVSEEMEAKEKAGTLTPGDLAKVYGGASRALGANNAELEIVKTAGGNWAEHMWVGEQLRTAMIQQGEGSDALEHNYELYQAFEEELGSLF